MNRLFHTLAQALSLLLYPMLMPLYGICLFAVGIQHVAPMLPAAYSAVCIVGTAVLTLIIPITLLLFIWRKGYVDSLHINERRQRTTTYVYTLICYGFWAYFLRATLQLPPFMLLIALGAIAALLAVTIINYWWKISAHLTGLGGLLGGVCSYAFYYSTLPLALILALLAVALLLMYARLYLRAHTPTQVVAGFILGLIATFIPTFIAYA
jgi:membrane-associated phospholipid phosphatase